MTTKQKLTNINEKIYGKLHPQDVGQQDGFYTINADATTTDQLLQATHNLFAAMGILNTRVTTENMPDMREAVMQLHKALSLLSENVADLDPEMSEAIQQFVEDPENQQFLSKLQENPVLYDMPTTQKEINAQLNLLYENCIVNNNSDLVVQLTQLKFRLAKNKDEPIPDEIYNVLENTFGVNQNFINENKNEENHFMRFIQVNDKIDEIGHRRFGKDVYENAKIKTLTENDGESFLPFQTREKPTLLTTVKMRVESLVSYAKTHIKPLKKGYLQKSFSVSSDDLDDLRGELKTLDTVYWLEHMDEQHRDRGQLLNYWNSFTTEKNLDKSITKERDYSEFFTWVDEKEANGAEKLARITYLEQTQQEFYQAEFKDDRITVFGGPADSSSIKGQRAGFAIYAIDKSGNLYLAEKQRHEFQHSSFLSGEDVACAGFMKIRNGKVYAITNSSGHYKPDDLDLAYTIALLKEKNVLHPNFKVKIAKRPFAKLGNELLNTRGMRWVANLMIAFNYKVKVPPEKFVEDTFRKYETLNNENRAQETTSSFSVLKDVLKSSKRSQQESTLESSVKKGVTSKTGVKSIPKRIKNWAKNLNIAKNKAEKGHEEAKKVERKSGFGQ